MFTKYSIKPEQLVLECKALDTLYWSSTISSINGLQKVMPRNVDKVMGGDLFNALYHWNPKLKDDPPDVALAAYMEKLMDSSDFMELRVRTMGDKNLAAAGAVRLFRELMRPSESDIKGCLNIKNALDNASTMGEEAGKIVGDAIKEAQQGMADSIKDGKRMDDQLLNSNSPRASINRVAEDMDAAEELSKYGTPPGSDPNQRSQQVLELLLDENLMAKISSQDELRKILKVAGRMRSVIDSIRSRLPVKSPPSPNVTYGSDLDLVMPIELAYLADPDLEDLFYVKLLEGDLRIKEVKDSNRSGQGPFIACLDLSGSMRGQAKVHALALFVTMARLAMEKRRSVWFIPFASSYAGPYKVDTAEQMIEILTNRYNIGSSTIIDGPMDRAAKIIEDDAPRADVMLISDMEVYTRNRGEWVNNYIDTKKRLDFKCLGFKMGSRDIDSHEATIRPILDSMCHMGSGGELSKLEWLQEVA